MLAVQDISKKVGDTTILKNISVNLAPQEAVALTGPSGSGKTSLLHILGLLDQPTSGHMTILGQNLQNLSEKKRTQLRRHHIGFVYQFHHLLPNFNALENAAMPLLIQGYTKKNALHASQSLLEEVGLGQRLYHRVHQLSGGEQQRVAIARALIHQPQILLADEPTGNLDSQNSHHIFTLLLDVVKKKNMTALIATHNEVLAKSLDRVVNITDGYLRT